METTQQIEKRMLMVLAYNLGALEDAFKQLEKKAKKLGVVPPTYIVGEYHPAHTIQASPNDPMANAYGEIHVPAKYEVTVEGEVPKLPGWDFVGTIEHTEHGNILRAMPGKEVSEEYRNSKPTCDHCGTVRRRADTFLVTKTESNELKRVGRACLKDYLGGKSPEQIAYLLGLESVLRSLCEDDMRQSSGYKGIEVVEFMANVVAVVEHQGYYVSRSTAQAKEQTATSDSTVANIEAARSTDPRRKESALPVTEAHTKQALIMLEWVRTREAKSSYDQNVTIVSHKAVLERRDYGLVASIIPSYNYAMGIIKKQQEELAANREAAKTLTYVGQIKKRQHFTATVDRILEFNNDFGFMVIVLMHDENGNPLVWKTSGHPQMPVERTFDGGQKYWDRHNLREGNTYKIKGTVKEHKLYKEKPQTVLTRVAFEELVSKADESV